MSRFLLVLLLIATPCYAQENWPGVEPIELNNTLHALGHAGAASLVIAGTGLVTNWPLKTRMGLGTVVWPTLSTVYDLGRWCDWSVGCINWDNEATDFLEHQLPWAYWFAKEGKWVSAIYTVVLYGAWVYWRYWHDPHTSLRDSYWWHGAAVGGYMAGLALIANVEPVPSYIQANAVLAVREIIQLATGQGEWTDLASGLLLPLPYLLER